MTPLFRKTDRIWFQAKKHFVMILAIFVTLGYLADLSFTPEKRISSFLNLFCVAIILLLILLTYISRLSSRQSFAVIVYTLVVNIMISFFLNYTQNDPLEADTLRSCLIISMILPIAGFVIEKKHAIYIGLTLLAYIISVIIYTHSKFLMENLFMLFIMISGYTFGIYYLLLLFEQLSENQLNLISELELKNNELESVNTILSEKTRLIKEQKEELKLTNDSKESIYSIISHDIKNPLFSIINFCNLIDTKIKKNLFEKVSEYNTMIHVSANNLYRLVLNLLDWSRMQGGHIQMNKTRFETGPQINETVNLYRHSAKMKDIGLFINIPENLTIQADINMFNTIVRNLLSNAIKFTPDGGTVSVDARLIDDLFFLSVKDSGAGLSREEIDAIITNPLSFSNPGTNNEYGTGLGLVLCKEFIHLHKGEFSINSVTGNGSTFTLSIPSGL